MLQFKVDVKHCDALDDNAATKKDHNHRYLSRMMLGTNTAGPTTPAARLPTKRLARATTALGRSYLAFQAEPERQRTRANLTDCNP